MGRGRTPKWTEDTAVNAIWPLTERLGRYPTEREFKAAGLHGLWQAIRDRLGGHTHIVALMNVPRARPWTELAALAAVRPLTEQLGRYPTYREFIAADRVGLYQAIDNHLGGHARFADRLHVARRVRWTPERALDAVRDLTGSCGRYPTSRAFRAAGLSGLYQFVEGQPGGHDRFAGMLGVARSPRRDRSTGPVSRGGAGGPERRTPSTGRRTARDG